MPELISPLELTPVDAPPEETVEPAGTSPGELDSIRDLVLRAHPDIVPELVNGETVADLLASVEPARAAWTRLADRLAERRAVPNGAAPSASAPLPRSSGSPYETPVPAGGGTPIAIDPDRLPASEKIRRGLATASQKG